MIKSFISQKQGVQKKVVHLLLYNTLSRKLEQFVPLKRGHVSLYCCGPTVYARAHIGNFRTYIFEDLLIRVLRCLGYQTNHVLNITDIGHLTGDEHDIGQDKMLKTAQEKKQSIFDIARLYTQYFFDDAKKLNLVVPNIVCVATDHIEDMINIAKRLEINGFVYESGGNLYFDTSKDPQYGILRGGHANSKTQSLDYHRVAKDNKKKHPEDFLLWATKSKFEDQSLLWGSPWGKGYPGWHLECTAMSVRYLGEKFDIHCGGVDHVAIHHTNELAQNYGACGSFGANYWLHGEFLLLNSEKMSKSMKNFLTLDQLENEGYDYLDYRYLCLGTHYRKQLTFHEQSILSAKQARKNLIQVLQKLQKNVNPVVQNTDGDSVLNRLKSHVYYQKFLEKICHDLNIPAALSVMWDLLKDSSVSLQDKWDLVLEMDEIFGLGLSNIRSDESEDVKCLNLSADLIDLIQLREQARQDKNYQEADRIRILLEDKGIFLEDTVQGTVWKQKI